MIRIQSVSKIYPGRIVALDHVSFNVSRGEFVFLVGPSGAGKSTLLKMLFREEVPTKGHVIIDRKDVSSLRKKDLNSLRRNVGIVFQDFRLLEDRTAYENVAYAMEVLEFCRADIKKRVPVVLDQVGMLKRAQHYPDQLSGGEQQKIAIARAIVNHPKILLADEPSGNMDPETALEIMHIFKEINRRRTTIIMATHDKMVVDAMRERVVALEAGRLMRDEQKGGYDYGY